MDTLAYSKRLRDAGFSQEQSEALAEGLRDAAHNDLATKADLAELKTELIKWMVGLVMPLYALIIAVLVSM